MKILNCIDKNGKIVFTSKNDVRTRVLDMETQHVSILEESREAI